MGAFFWPETTYTVMSCDGVVTHLNMPAEVRARLKKDAKTKPWVERAEAKGEPVIVATKQALGEKDEVKAAEVCTVAAYEAKLKADAEKAEAEVLKEKTVKS